VIRMSWGSHFNRFRRINPQREREYTNEFVDQVVALWDQKVDTSDIALALHQSPAACERALHIGLERRRTVTAREVGG
jgi:hypothetical protein